MTEKQLQNIFINFLNHHKIYYIKTIVCSKSGVPDIIACIDGKFCAFELKSSTGKESDLQIYNGEKIVFNGGEYTVVTPTNYCEVTNAIEKIYNSKHYPLP